MPATISYLDKPWLDFYEPDVPAAIDYEEICLPDFLERSAAKYPDRMALSFEGATLTFHQLKEMVDRFATFLTKIGVKKGDRVAIVLPNVVPCVVSYFGILKLGGIVVMNNPLYSDRELKYQFNDSGATVLITLDLLANRMIELRPKTKIEHIITTGIPDYLPSTKKVLLNIIAKLPTPKDISPTSFIGRMPKLKHIFTALNEKKRLITTVKPADNVYSWTRIMTETPIDPPSQVLSFDDVAMYQYSGGTTGVSKGVILTHENLSKQVQQVEAWFPKFKNTAQIMLGALPFFHVFGLSTSMNFAVYQGWGNALVPKPQPKQLLNAIQNDKPTFAPMVPTMYIGLMNYPGIEKVDLTSINGCFSGSAPLPVEVIRDFEAKTGAIIVEGYGLTESTPVTHVNPFGGKRKVGSIGVPISDTICRVVDLETGDNDMPVGEPGELVIKGPQVMMKGYLNRPDETAMTLRDGWLYTGDIAKMDEDGYFFIVDRKKDMIISGGYNIYPRDIDEVFYEHPKIMEACTIGIPHSHRGEAVKVFVVPKTAEMLTEEELLVYCKDKLARYKLPEEIEFRDELPKSAVGKVLRKELRNEEIKKRQQKP